MASRTSTGARTDRRPSERSLLAMMDETQSRLQNLELSCRQILDPSDIESDSNDSNLLQLQVRHLRAQLLAAVARREDEDLAFRQAAQYATAKGSANGVLHTLFDQASSGKTAVLKAYLDTGSIPTRDGLRHWKLDLRTLRNDAGATLLHVAVGVSTARQSIKVKLVHLLVDRVGFNPNVRDVFGQTPLHVAAMGGYQEVVQALLERGCDPVAQDRSGLTALSLARTLSRPPEGVVQTLVQAETVAARDQFSKSSLIPLHNIAKTRQVWYYAVLFKASTHAFPGTLTVKSGSDVIVSSENVSKYFPLEDRLAIGAEEYFATEYDPQTRQIRLDHKYKGNDAANVKAYLTGSCSPLLPPYVTVKRIWEREPGNKYEDQMSSEQELFQDYQFLDPESEYEVAIKLGPIPSGKDARSIVTDWKRRSKELFDSRK
ncbi:hypothetical protein BBJ29_002805 [Phytophthora kernoviae]|uniref:Uncharacterized protein n=1 Tax=Phytophthora kernoviae TaxID=325452 RepID=A0A3F2RPG5_9STRA|nr:hypothetical protein BBJ29_002805 [Phytophthora kernoviae]RLN61644.1 hypothetical protein BBP00_00005257 [Phytophthora kernoviae]